MSSKHSTFIEAVEYALLNEGAQELNLSKDENKCLWRFKLERLDKVWPLYLRVYNDTLAPLPYIHWESLEPIWGWPHISSDGAICVFERQGLNYDAENINGILKAIIDKSMDMLIQYHALSENERLQLFADELEAYAQNMGIPSLTFDAPLDGFKRVPAVVSQNYKSQNCWIIESINSPEVNRKSSRISLNVIDININNLPPLITKPTKSWWLELTKKLSPNKRAILVEKRGCGVILRVKNRFGFANILLFWGNQERENESRTFWLEPTYHEYLTRRVGEQSRSRRVAVIGVGSVGSRVAENLALTGIKHITLIDSDEMRASNLGRHVLTKYSIGQNKALAMASNLKSRMPGIDVRYYTCSAQNWLNAEMPSNYDVIVMATGDIAGERLLLRRAWREGWTCKIVSTFVEAANLGGHAISMQPGEQGCLECLCIVDNITSIETFRTNMLELEPGQTPLQEVSGCGAFTPYSAISATRTALLAVELTFPNAAIGYHRWAGNDEQAKTLNLKPSEFWHALKIGNASPFVLRKDYIRGDCKCCSN